MIKDPELIKQIGVKDFEYFMNHRKLASEHLDPLFAKGLFFLQDQKWKDMRSTLSPAFTGSKMRLMFDLLTECAKNSMKTLKEQIHESSSDALEMKELFTKFTVDIIATCAFGLEVNSFKNPDNEFVKIRKVIDDFNKPQAAFKMLGFGMFPKLMEFFKLRLMDESTCEVFQATITDTIKIRVERKIVRHDMINLLMQANKGQLSHDKSVEDAKEGFAMDLILQCRSWT